MAGILIAIVGAESTGKTDLAQSLSLQLASATGLSCAVVPEVLRDWCVAASRTPQAHEQPAIARTQTEQIDAAALCHDLVLCDTTALMTAVYSQLLFQDESLLASGLAFHRRCAVTLLTAIDLPWIPDGLQRDGAHVRGPVDASIRTALSGADLRWHLIAGQGQSRVNVALQVLLPAIEFHRSSS
jgi:nicotinamide riboside kinase